MTPFDFRPRTRIVFGPGEFARLGELARELNAARCLVVADPGIVQAGYSQDAIRTLKARRMEVSSFNDFRSDPTPDMLENAKRSAKGANPDLIVAVGGGTTLDFAKALNVVLSCGGSIQDYSGYGNITQPLLPMIAVPTTAGTGSEAQTSAYIYDPDASSHKTTCGDPKLAYRVAVLDPKLTLTQPRALTASAGYHAIANAIESMFSTRGTPISDCYSREAWRLLDANFERVLAYPDDLEARSAVLLAAHFAGVAVESSSLGPARACAQSLMSAYRLSHGAALALTLSGTLEWKGGHADLAQRVRYLASAAELPTSLRDIEIPEEALPRLADGASIQWTGRFGGRHFDAIAAMEIYQAAQ